MSRHTPTASLIVETSQPLGTDTLTILFRSDVLAGRAIVAELSATPARSSGLEIADIQLVWGRARRREHARRGPVNGDSYTSTSSTEPVTARRLLVLPHGGLANTYWPDSQTLRCVRGYAPFRTHHEAMLCCTSKRPHPISPGQALLPLSWVD